MTHANDNSVVFYPTIDLAIAGQALMIRRPSSKHGTCYAEFLGHAGDGKHIIVRKLIASMWKSHWTKPMKILRADVVKVHFGFAARTLWEDRDAG